MKVWLALALALAACEESDPCDGRGPVCIVVQATGDVRLDEIDVTTLLPTGTRLRGRTVESTEEFALPVQFALRLPENAIGLVGIDLIGLRGGIARAAGGTLVTVPDSGRARVVVPLGAFDADLGAPDLAVPLPADLSIRLDAAEPAPTLSPASLDFGSVLVGASRTAQLIFVNPRARDVVVRDIQLVPSGPPFGFAASGTCKPNESLSPMQSCTVELTFSPTMRQTVFAQVKLTFGALGETSATVGGRGVAWLAESLETPDGSTAPNLLTVWGLSLDAVWAGGDASGLYRRAAGWTKLTPPGGITVVSGLWGTSSTDVYLISNQTKQVFHFGANGSWASDVLASTGEPLALFGLNAGDVFVASNTGEVFRGVAGGPWAPIRAPASGPDYALWGTSAENLYATGTEIAHRTPTGWSSLAIPAPTGYHRALWGSGPNDIYSVGQDFTMGYGFIKHSNGMQFSTEMLPNQIAALHAVWGASADEVYATGGGGLILRKSASGWVAEASGTTADLHAVWGTGGEVFAVGDAGTILHRY